jgi:hypothetical protein
MRITAIRATKIPHSNEAAAVLEQRAPHSEKYMKHHQYKEKFYINNFRASVTYMYNFLLDGGTLHFVAQCIVSLRVIVTVTSLPITFYPPTFNAKIKNEQAIRVLFLPSLHGQTQIYRLYVCPLFLYTARTDWFL